MKPAPKVVKNLTIHGINHIFDSSRSKLSRFFWTIVFLSSLSGLSYYVTNLYIKLNYSPDINIRTKKTLINQIPFPAVTFCAPTFAKNQLSSTDKFMKELVSVGKLDRPLNMSIEEQNFLSSNIHACYPPLSDAIVKLAKNRTDIDIVKYLNESFHTIPEIFPICGNNESLRNCEEILRRVLTNRGYCYGFNLLDMYGIFHRNSISSDFKCYKHSKERSEWSLENGFNRNSSAHSYPQKVIKGNKLFLLMGLRQIDATNLCVIHGKVFSFYLHLPNEIVVPFAHREHYVEFGRRKDITLSAKSYKTDKGMQRYSPEVRGCYFEGEKQLKYFKTYTKSLCEYECMTNYTFKTCGCVKFSMPRTSTTPICGLEKAKCYFTAMESWPVYESLEDKFSATCGCLKSCTYIEYGIKFEKNSINEGKNYENYINFSNWDILSELMLEFADHEIVEYEDYVAYNLYNFVADAGGILGLFLGCSLLSLIEVAYLTLEALIGKIKGRLGTSKTRSVASLRKPEKPNKVAMQHPDIITYYIK